MENEMSKRAIGHDDSIWSWLANTSWRFSFRWLLMSLSLIPGVHATSKDVETGWAYYKAQDYEKATLQFRKAIDVQPDMAEPYAGLGWSLYWQQKYGEAETAFRSALERDAGNASAAEGLATVRKWRYADFNAAWNAYYGGRYADALNLFQTILTSGSARLPAEDMWQVHSGLGWSAYALQNYELAQQAFTTIIALDPNNAYALKGLGFAAYQTGKYDQALELLSKALANNPDWSDVISMQGWALYSKQEFDKAEEHFNAAIAANPFLADPYYGLGWTAFRLNDLTNAKRWFREGIQRGPAHPSARDLFALIDKRKDWWDLYAPYGWAYHNAGLYSDALATFRYGSSKVPDDVLLYCGMGFSLFRLGQYKEAVDNLSYCLRIKPGLPPVQETLTTVEGTKFTVQNDAQSLLAWAKYYLQDYEAARSGFETSLKTHGSWPSSHSGLGWTLLRMGKTDEALASFQTALEFDPTFADALNGLTESRKGRYERFNAAWTVYYEGNYSKAVSEFTALADTNGAGLDPGDKWKIYSGLGWASLGAGQYAQALDAFRKGSAMSPGNPHVEKGLAYAMAETGQHQEAVAALTTWIKSNGEDPDVRLHIALALQKMNKHNEAINELDRVLNSLPGSSAALRAMAESQQAIGQADQAAIYREAAERVAGVPAPAVQKASPAGN